MRLVLLLEIVVYGGRVEGIGRWFWRLRTRLGSWTRCDASRRSGKSSTLVPWHTAHNGNAKLSINITLSLFGCKDKYQIQSRNYPADLKVCYLFLCTLNIHIQHPIFIIIVVVTSFSQLGRTASSILTYHRHYTRLMMLLRLITLLA